MELAPAVRPVLQLQERAAEGAGELACTWHQQALRLFAVPERLQRF